MFKNLSLTFFILLAICISPNMYAQVQRLGQPFRTTQPPQDTITFLSVRFISGVTRNGEALQITDASIQVVLQQFGITSDRIQSLFPGLPNGQELLQNEIGEWYSTPDVSKIAVLALPRGIRPEPVISALLTLPTVSSASIYTAPQIERD